MAFWGWLVQLKDAQRMLAQNDASKWLGPEPLKLWWLLANDFFEIFTWRFFKAWSFCVGTILGPKNGARSLKCLIIPEMSDNSWEFQVGLSVQCDFGPVWSARHPRPFIAVIHGYKTWINSVPCSVRCILVWGQTEWNGTISTRNSMLSTWQYDDVINGFPPARLCLSLLLLQCDFGAPCPYNFKCGVIAIGKTRVASKTSETTSASWWLLSNLSSLPSAIKHQNIFMFWGSKLFGQSHRFSNTIFCLATFVSALHLTLQSALMPTRLDAIQ